MLKDMKIGNRLNLGFGLLVLMIVIVGASAFLGISSIKTQTQHLVEEEGRVARTAAEVHPHILNLRRYEKDVLLNMGSREKVSEYGKKWEKELVDLGELLKSLEKEELNPEQTKALKELAEHLAKYAEGFRSVFAKIQDGTLKTAQAANAALGAFKDNVRGLESLIDTFEDHIGENMKRTEAGVIKGAETTLLFIGVLIIVSTAIAFAVSIPTSRSIVVPVKEIAEIADRIAAGDLSVEIKAQRKDEIGMLADSFRAMVVYLKGMAGTAEAIAQGDLRGEVTPKSDKDVLGNAFHEMVSGLRSIVTEIKGGADQIASASGQIASTSEQTARNNESAATAVEETTSTMHEMSANIQNVAKNAQNQSSSVTETSASIEQMVASIQRIADTVNQFVQLSAKTKQAVEQGLDAVAKSVKGTDEISRSIVRSSDTISALGARVEDIGKIVDVIDEIAEQTNLLALNAAIEAARAGEQGQGFAVVADEVRKLAERSAKSTKEIAELISGIQREAQDAVKVMEKSTQLVERGVELSSEVGNTLKAIENNVVEVDRYSKEIGAATQEQSSGSTQIGKAAENLREVTHEISSATDEQASAAEQIVKTMEKMREMIHQNAAATTELASSAEELRSQAERFQDIIGRFSVGDEDAAGKRPARQKELPHHDGNGRDKTRGQHKLIGAA
ncbi:MAG: methyl-accepting chemotaxis protein [Nitrospirota bacterium]|nr:methyl-accepting chemotaxis protein [Nitrospirota bacterium]